MRNYFSKSIMLFLASIFLNCSLNAAWRNVLDSCYQSDWVGSMSFNQKVTLGSAAFVAGGGAFYYLRGIYKKSAEKKLASMTFWDFKKRCDALPDFKLREIQEYQKAQKGIDDQNTRTAVTPFMMHKALDDYFSLVSFNNEEWVNEEVPTKIVELVNKKDDYSLNPSTMFDPYAQKLVLKDGKKAYKFGDRHGDVHSLLASLANLVREGVLDPEDPFKIADKDSYFIFHGDLTDRGWYGIDVTYTVLRLKIANPKQVILVRGNHEDISINDKEKVNSFSCEINRKFCNSFIDRALSYVPFYKPADHNKKLLYKVSKMYETLPVLLFLGCKDEESGITNYEHCCHGGPEIGFRPKKLLKHASPLAYTKLGTLMRKKQLEKVWQKPELVKTFIEVSQNAEDLGRVKRKITSSKDLEENLKADILEEERQDFEPTGILSKLYHSRESGYTTQEVGDQVSSLPIGSLWNDLEVDEDMEKRGQFVKSTQGRGWIIGKTFHKAILALWSTKKHIIRGTCRAHQHSDDPQNPMMKRILNVDKLDHQESIGIGRLWLPQEVLSLAHNKLWDNYALTLCVSPYTPYQAAGVMSDTIGQLTLRSEFERWTLDAISV